MSDFQRVLSFGSLWAGGLLSLLFTPGASSAQQWSEFRGPTGQGHAAVDSAPRQWGRDTNVVWRTPIAGEGWSSPVIDQGRIYLTSAVKPDRAQHENDRDLNVLCIDAQDGQIIWLKRVFAQDGAATQKIHSKNSHASPTPIVEDERIYVHFGTHGTACLDTTGKILWRNRQLKYVPQHGNGGSPVLFEDLLIVSCDGTDVQFVVALDKRTGEIAWKSDRPPIPTRKKFSFSTPLVVSINGEPQLISPGTDHVVAYNPRNGDSLWQVDYTGYSVIPRPIYGQGLVFVSTSYDRPKLLAIDPTGSGNVTDTHVKWSTSRGAPHTPSPLLVGEELYFVSDGGVATCVDARTGQVHWTERLGGNYSASPVLAAGAIYFQSEQGVTTVVRPGREYEELARSDLEERTLASLAFQEGAVFLRTDQNLYRFGAGR